MPLKKINLELTPNLSYILGVCLGDGSVWKYVNKNKAVANYIVSLRATSPSFVNSFKNALESIGLHTQSRIIYRKEPWQSLKAVEAYSKMFYDWFSSLRLEEIELLLDDKKDLIISFIRGFYESEGNCKLINRRYPYCRMFSASKDLLELIHRLLEKIGFKSKIYDNYKGYHGQTIYCLAIIGGAEETERFLREIRPACKIPTPQIPLKMYKPRWKPHEIEILQKYYSSGILSLKSKLPNRSLSSIYHKVSRLNIKKGKLTPTEP
jgi:hypothetical protein